MSDAAYMARALGLAERGRGRTSPNPVVGAVIVDDEGVVVGRGAHEVAGGPHAEIHALNDAGPRARGATLYCTRPALRMRESAARWSRSKIPIRSSPVGGCPICVRTESR
jgi:tRNA(Arg) A34 adenosine deaminase TadA